MSFFQVLQVLPYGFTNDKRPRWGLVFVDQVVHFVEELDWEGGGDVCHSRPAVGQVSDLLCHQAFLRRLSSISATTPPTMPAMIDSTGNPGIPGLEFRVTVNVCPSLVGLIDWDPVFAPCVKVTV